MRPRARGRDLRRPRRPARRRRARSSPRRSSRCARRSPGMGIEVLIPDFDGSDDRLRTVMDARPDILNHNLETVKRLQKPVRKRARWDRSLYVLRRAKDMRRDRLRRPHEELADGRPGRDARRAERGVRGAPRGRRRHPHDRPVPAAVGEAPAARALLPPRRVRRDEGRGPRPRLQARRIRRRSSAPATTPATRSRARSSRPSVAVRRRSTRMAASSPSQAEVPPMGVDRSYVARNDASRQRLAARLDDLTANELLTPLADGWTVGGLLAHLAFWDRLVVERWALAARQGKPTPIDISEEMTDLVNDAAMPAWLAVNRRPTAEPRPRGRRGGRRGRRGPARRIHRRARRGGPAASRRPVAPPHAPPGRDRGGARPLAAERFLVRAGPTADLNEAPVV